MIPQDAGVGVEQHRDQGQPRQGADGPHRREVRVVSPHQAELDHGEQKQWKKQQLHVLPGGLVDGGEGRRQHAAAAPLVHKVEQRPRRPCKHKSRQFPEKQVFPHHIPPETQKRTAARGRSSILCGLWRIYARKIRQAKITCTRSIYTAVPPAMDSSTLFLQRCSSTTAAMAISSGAPRGAASQVTPFRQ